ncbi:glycosyl transferase family 1 [Sphaerisporangium krabiense]|uniref:Glycosyltransferase involved in cell wall biosynthesis n=1 Tax=Sphaerisporangium krabiense TaxID=763782 RepID=A0A7W8YZT6_9ACTN|nr:glycosyltransferase [Sphaerisporangium krabiense]MBB5624858.1 glycosyltransferase involved in cell wall biosynthesis [Sphaerisporangium krabiense]GII66440.1 glycosyl transferase family 1 [Sphaerisporangium krabiense]
MTSRAAASGRGQAVVFACMDADTLGGVQQVTHIVAQGLALRGHDVHVVGLHRSPDPFRFVEHPLYEHHVVQRRPPGAGRPWAARGRVSRLLSSLGQGYAVLTSPAVVSWLAGALPSRFRAIGQYHGSYEHARGTWHFASVRRHYGDLARSVFLSPEDAARFAEQALLPNADDVPNPLRAWPAAPSFLDVPRVLGVGRLAWVKRFDRLITAFARAARTRQDWQLHLVGDGPELPRLRAHAASLGMAGRVVFRGRVPAAEIGREYLNGAILGLTSEHEGFPLVVGEAASYGMPAVAFDVSGGVRALVRHGTTGVLVPPADLGALTGALAGLMADHARRRRLGAAARAHAEAFRLERVLDRWEEVFARISR